MNYLAEIKSITGLDDSQNETLNTIVNLIQERLKLKTQQTEVPEELNYIVVEASISRFNRINDEGKKSANEGEVSSTYLTDDLLPFYDDIADWVADNVTESTEGKFTFY